MATEPPIRDATHDDLQAIRAVVFAAAAEYGFPPEPEGADSDLFAHVDQYFGAGGMLRVLEDAGQVVGLVGVVPHGAGVVELRKIYLAASHRGGGSGRRLLEEAVAFARQSGAARLVLQTSSRLAEALRLYERAGFVRVEGLTRSCTCDVAMELALGPTAGPGS